MPAGKQVIFCTDGIFPHAVGGMQRHSALLIEGLAEMDAFDLIVIHPHNEQLFSRHKNITEIPLNYSHGKKNYLASCYTYSKLVYEQLKRFPKALVYSQGLSVWKGIEEQGKRVIVNPHGLEPYQTIDMVNYLKTAPLRYAFGKIFRHASKIISLGGYLTTILRRITGDAEKIAVIPNAVNCGEYPARNFDKDKLQLLFVGRFASNKGIHLLMKAVDDLNNGGYQNRLHYNLVGRGPLFEKYVSENKNDNVTFHGFADDNLLSKMYLENDLFVFPTLYEGMPTVVLEAMSAGMPVIVSDTGATAELVDRRNGFLIEKNNIRALKWAIQQFYQLTPAQRQLLSVASWQHVKDRFTWNNVARMHAELFKSISV